MGESDLGSDPWLYNSLAPGVQARDLILVLRLRCFICKTGIAANMLQGVLPKECIQYKLPVY